MSEHLRVSLRDSLEASLGFAEPRQSFVLSADPAHQVGVDAPEEGFERGVVERSVVLHPPSHDGVDDLCELGEGVACAPMDAPSADIGADLLKGFLADRWQEARESDSVLAARRADAEREPQEGERRVLI